MRDVSHMVGTRHKCLEDMVDATSLLNDIHNIIYLPFLIKVRRLNYSF